MPERPDLEYVLPRLQAALVGREIRTVEVFKPVIFRVMVPGTPQELLGGRKILGIRRLAHFLDFSLDGLRMAVNPMLAGRFSFEGKKRGDTAAVFTAAFGFNAGCAGVGCRFPRRFFPWFFITSEGLAHLQSKLSWTAVSAVQCVFQDLTGLERQDPAGADGDLVARLRIPSNARVFIAHDEVPEPGELDLLTAL